MPEKKDQGLKTIKCDSLVGLITDIMRMALQEIHQQILSELPCKTTPQQMVVGAYLLDHGGRLTVTDIANKLGVSLSAVTASTNRMGRSGLLGRYRDEADRRVVWLELTSSGIDTVNAFMRIRDRLWCRLFDTLADHDRMELYRILSKMKQAAQGLQAGPGA